MHYTNEQKNHARRVKGYMNTKTADALSDAYRAGMTAFVDGIEESDNPHDEGSELWESWALGFYDERERS